MAKLYLRKASIKFLNLRTNQALEIGNLRIAFKIEKSETSTSNSSTITIFNLGPNSRKFVEIPPEEPGKETKKGLFVELTAGYEGLEKVIFSGDASAKNKFEQPDWITELTCGDALNRLRVTNFQKSFKKGTPIQSVIQQVVESFQVDIGFIKPTITSDVAQFGLSLSGPSKKLLDDFAAKYNFIWSIQNNAIQITDQSTAVPATAIALSPETGLLKKPVKKDKGIEFECLLIPTLAPGVLVSLSGNEEFSGIVKVNRVEFEGDSFEGDYKATVQATVI